MTKLDHYNATKKLLKKIVRQRRSMFVHNRSYLKATEEIVRTMASVEYTVAHIRSFDKMMGYLGTLKIQLEIRRLIPANFPSWRAEFDWLIIEGQRLQGVPVKHPNELNFEIINL